MSLLHQRMDDKSKDSLSDALSGSVGEGAGEGNVNVSCMALFDAFWSCGNPGSQMKFYYKSGQYQDCMTYLGDWRRCLQLKGTSDPVKAKALVEAMTSLPTVKGAVEGSGGVVPMSVAVPHLSSEIWELENKPTWIKK